MVQISLYTKNIPLLAWQVFRPLRKRSSAETEFAFKFDFVIGRKHLLFCPAVFPRKINLAVFFFFINKVTQKMKNAGR